MSCQLVAEDGSATLLRTVEPLTGCGSHKRRQIQEMCSQKEHGRSCLLSEICSNYLEISFRLGDREEGARHKYWMGYNNSMNQVGKNFGEMDWYGLGKRRIR